MTPDRYNPAPSIAPGPGWQHPGALTGEVQLYAERPRGPVKYVPSAENPSRMVAVPAEYVQPMLPMPVRDLTPQPLFDPLAQRMVGAGIGGGALSAGLGWGIGQALTPLAGMSSGVVMWLAIAVIAWKTAPALARQTINNISNHTTVHASNRWFGHNHTTTHTHVSGGKQ